jgi:type IV pilus assembly protein PilW
MTSIRVLNTRHHMSAQGGVSLIELMIAMVRGLLVIIALVTIFSATSRARAELERTNQQIQNGRDAVQMLSDDLQLAGYYGELSVAPIMPPSILPDPCSTDRAVWDSAVALHVQGYDDGTALPACLPASVRANTDVIAIRRAGTCIAGAAGCEPLVAGEPYLQVSMCQSSPEAHVLGVLGTHAFALTQKDCTGLAPLRSYRVHTYFVSDNNGQGRQTPTLTRLELTAAGFIQVPLVEGIERLEIEYGIDTDGDGSPDIYTSAPGNFSAPGCSTCTPSRNWSNVVAVKLHVLARALEISPGYVDTKQYRLGSNAAGEPLLVGPLGDAHRRHVYTGTVRLMNPSGRREAP